MLGVDACRTGWVGVQLRDGEFAAAHAAATLAGLLEAVPGARIVGVDMPLGLLGSGERVAERLARRRLGRRASSIFLTPPRPVLEQPDYDTAKALCRTLVGWMPSRQAWGLRDKLLEANALYDAFAELYEVHPESSFAELGLRPEDGGKKTWRGQRARLRVLADAGVVLPEDLGAAVARVPADDVLDAAAAAWTADRIARGAALCLPDPPQYNERGRPVAIWC
ncbi:MAG: DUF429 domain-containing protein [Mycolicibacterium hassiacum]|uniref:DUF429 domain-containing protein n=1 Tax=Mycolicibacterium hassiacum TaxID=46351 RepID=UPI0003121D93|nr:DUF429 domain-containing protein [Mycolicibacterium hassiacum]